MLSKLTEDDMKVMDIGDLHHIIPRLVIDKDLQDEEISELRHSIPQAIKLLDLIKNTTIDMTQRERSLLDLLLELSLDNKIVQEWTK